MSSHRSAQPQVRDAGRRRITVATAASAAGGTALAVLFGTVFAHSAAGQTASGGAGTAALDSVRAAALLDTAGATGTGAPADTVLDTPALGTPAPGSPALATTALHTTDAAEPPVAPRARAGSALRAAAAPAGPPAVTYDGNGVPQLPGEPAANDAPTTTTRTPTPTTTNHRTPTPDPSTSRSAPRTTSVVPTTAPTSTTTLRPPPTTPRTTSAAPTTTHGSTGGS